MPSEAPEDETREPSPPAGQSPAAGSAALPARLRAWAAANRLKAALAGAACLISVAAVASLWFVFAKKAPQEPATLDMALDALDEGDTATARRIAEALRLKTEAPTGPSAYVLGAALSREAEAAQGAESNALYARSISYLEEAHHFGFPEGRDAEGLFLLGRNLCRTGRIMESRPALREAMAADADRAAAVHQLLAEGYLNEPDPKYREALEENGLYLASPSFDARQRNRGLLQRVLILLRLGNTAEAGKLLAELQPEAGEQAALAVLRGQVLLEEARRASVSSNEAAGAISDRVLKCREAMGLFQQAARDRSVDHAPARQAAYLIGAACQEMGDDQKALQQWMQVAHGWPGTPEALAADFQAGEITQKLGRDAEAAGAYRQALDCVKDTSTYSNPWIALGDLEKRTVAAYHRFIESGKYDSALQLARHACPLLSRAEATEMEADASRQWARDMLDRSAKLPAAEAARLAARARQQMRLAGRAYHQLARLRLATKNYPDDLWNAAECLFEGRDYREAAATLDLYLENESRRRRPRALLSLGEALLSLGQTERALTVLEECIEFHATDAAAYQARLLASAAHAEAGEVREAEQLLEENLTGFLAPQSIEWRDSLFALGFLLSDQKRDEEALRRLDEAVRRYPDAPQAVEASYRMGQCCRRSAESALARTESDPVEADRLAGSKKAQAMLAAALDHFQAAQEKLNQRQETGELTGLEMKTLRNCYFALGATLFELGRYEEAIRAYTSAASRYQNYPESLEAYTQIARAYRRLNNPERARAMLEQAKVLLGRMKNTTAFANTTIYDQPAWAELLGWLQTL